MPGVYAWVADEHVMYVGKARQLRQIVQGARMNRPYNDYTYLPASKVGQLVSPRVRVNGLLNQSLTAGSVVMWWWMETESEPGATTLEAQLISDLRPPWNRARPSG